MCVLGGGGGVIAVVHRCRIVHRRKLGDCPSPRVLPRAAEMIEIKSTGSLV